MKTPGHGTRPFLLKKRNIRNIRNIPLIERTLVFRMIERFRNTTTMWNRESRIGKPMFHMFRMFRLIRGWAA